MLFFYCYDILIKGELFYYKNNRIKSKEVEYNMDENLHTEKKPTVLIIDDNAILLRTVKEMLERDFDVRIATSSEQAFKSFEIRIPDIILLDYELPEMNGEETLKILHKDKLTMHIPVIFLTSSSDRRIVTKLLSLNPDGYVIKPPKKAVIIDHIRRVLYPEEYADETGGEQNAEQKKV